MGQLRSNRHVWAGVLHRVSVATDAHVSPLAGAHRSRGPSNMRWRRGVPMEVPYVLNLHLGERSNERPETILF
jgi:hypothetical protein